MLNSYRVEEHIARIPSERCSTQPRLAVGVNQVRIPHAVSFNFINLISEVAHAYSGPLVQPDVGPHTFGPDSVRLHPKAVGCHPNTVGHSPKCCRMVAEKCNADVGPRSGRRCSDIGPTSLLRPCSDVARTSLRRRSDIAPTLLDITPTSG